MSNSSALNTNQPVIYYLEKSTINNNNNTHKNKCEQFCTCNSTKDKNCPKDCDEFINGFNVKCLASDDDIFDCFSCLCLPITLPINSIFFGPCAIYNALRNKCDNNKDSKNYLC
jgi:hypothetical protein